MYGTVAKFKVMPGKLSEFEKRAVERRPMDGFQMLHVFQNDEDENEIWMVVIFDDKDTYFKNANTPEQNSEYLKLRELMASEPEWHDGIILFTQTKEDIM